MQVVFSISLLDNAEVPNLSAYLFILVAFYECHGAKFLAVLPIPIHSHHRVFKPILNELVNRGHEVTVITASPDENPKYKQIIITNILDGVDPKDIFGLRKVSRYSNFFFLSFFGEKVVHHFLQSPEVQQIVHSKDLNFDAIIVEATFSQEAVVAFGHKFQAPIIEFQSLCSNFWLNDATNNPYTLSHSIDFWTPYSDKMNFLQRLENTVFGVTQVLTKRFVFLPRQQGLADSYLNYTGWEMRPPLDEMLSNIALVILNTHLALHYPHPNNPNVIEVAGLHLKPPKKLPKELQDYLDNAREGVIYFSLGSNLKSSIMPDEIKQNIITAFGKLPYKVLWKYEEDSMINKPENVKISKWFPQTDILAHPNVKLFITHGGFFSIIESTHNAVPVISIPIYGDQYKNSKQAETSGFGITLTFDDITVDSFISSIQKIITQSSYREAAQRHSKILNDNPMPPLDTVLFWIEYVLRHNGAPHLQTAARHLKWYQYFLLDVIAVLAVTIITVLYILYFSLKVIFSMLCGKKITKNPVKARKKKN